MNGPGSVENQGHSLEQKKIAPDSDVRLNLPITANHWRDIPAQHEFYQPNDQETIIEYGQTPLEGRHNHASSSTSLAEHLCCVHLPSRPQLQ
jgi:hypothetical protein